MFDFTLEEQLEYLNAELVKAKGDLAYAMGSPIFTETMRKKHAIEVAALSTACTQLTALLHKTDFEYYNPNYTMTFGKYTGRMLYEIIRNDPFYLEWLIQVNKEFASHISPEMADDINDAIERIERDIDEDTSDWGSW